MLGKLEPRRNHPRRELLLAGLLGIAWIVAGGDGAAAQAGALAAGASGAPAISGASGVVDLSAPPALAAASSPRLAAEPSARPAALAAPTSLVGNPLSSSSIQLLWQLNSTNETAVHVEMAVLGAPYAEVQTLAPGSTESVIQNLAPATGYTFRVRVGNAAGVSPYSNEAQVATLGVAGRCVPDAQTLCLSNGRFRAAVTWRTPAQTGNATVVPVSSADSGLLWFFDPDNWEMLIKVLDGCAIDNTYWVFLAATTNVGYQVSVTDTLDGQARVYYHPLNGAPVSLTDTSALAVCP